MDNVKKYWFPAKRIGWGWGLPNCWQGWVVLAGYAIAQWLLWYLLPPAREMTLFLIGVALSTIILLGVMWLNGEPPGAGRWR